MRYPSLHTGLLLGALSLTCVASAQEIIHGVTGKVTAVWPATKTLVVDTDDGSEGHFDILTRNVPITFEKNVKAMTVPASSFTKADCQVVVFFFGEESARTVVAVEDLGSAPLVNTTGTIVKLDKHAHLLTIRGDSGEEQIFQIGAKTLADSMYGVMEGQKFSADKGAKVKVTASTENGAPTAIFIRALSF
jgi:hypothetical protein